MQTFLPFKDFTMCAQSLDRYRLGKQRVECIQILCALDDEWALTVFPASKGWRNHPVVKMWAGYENALKHYYNAIRSEWIARGYKNSLPEATVTTLVLPEWLNDDLCRTYREILIFKQYNSKVKLDRDYKAIFEGH